MLICYLYIYITWRILFATCVCCEKLVQCSIIIQCWCKLHMHCSDFCDCYSRRYHACNSPLFLNMNDYFFLEVCNPVRLFAQIRLQDSRECNNNCNYTWTQTFVAWHCIGLWARGWSSSSWWSCSKTPQCNTRPTLVQNTSL